MITGALLAMALMGAGPRPDPKCTITSTELSIVNLDPRVPFSFTFEPYPIGTTIYPNPDGTWSQARVSIPPLTVYVWVRGHGPSLIKGSKQIGDYHVVAICSL